MFVLDPSEYYDVNKNSRNIFKNIFSVQQNKVIQVWNNMRVSKYDSFHFWVNCLFKANKIMKSMNWN